MVVTALQRRSQSALWLLSAVLGTALAQAQAAPGEDTSYVPLTREVGINISGIRGASGVLDFTDDSDFYFVIKVNGDSSGHLYVDYCTKGYLWYLNPSCNCGDLEWVQGTHPEHKASVASCKKDVLVTVKQYQHNDVFDDDKALDGSFFINAATGEAYGNAYLSGTVGNYWIFDPSDNMGGAGFSVVRGPDSALGGDSDGDGLLDHWEQYGYDANCDSRMIPTDDVFLHQMGANMNHKDLFVHVDAYDNAATADKWRITKADIDEVVASFARAPVDSAGIANPDGQPGINLHVDHFDRGNIPTAFVQSHSLGDDSTAPTSGDDWAAKRAVLQGGNRTGLFRFAMVGPIWDDMGGYGTGDFVYLKRTDGIAFMHELGHTFGLQHGGNEAHNCKPNHLSVMNYLYAKFGVPYGDAKGALQRFLDFAPAMIPPDRGLSLNGRIPDLTLLNLNENSLSEAAPLVAPTPTMNLALEMIIVQADRMNGVRVPISTWPNWNQNFTPDEANPKNQLPVQDPGTLQVQLDDFTGLVGDCASNGALEALNTFDEWRNLRVKPNRDTSGALLPGVVLYTGGEPADWTPEQAKAFEESLHTTDLGVTVTVEPDPMRAGETAVTTVKVFNRGPNPAEQPQVLITLPAGLTSVVLPTQCAAPILDVSTCTLPVMAVGATQTLQFAATVGENSTGGSRQVSVQVKDLAGPDPALANNVASVRLRVLPKWSSFEDAARPWLPSWNPAAGPFPTSANVTHGQYSMAVGCGYFDISSPLFDTTEWDVISDRIALDVFVPSAVPNPDWVGEVQLFFVAQSAGIYGVELGRNALTSLPRGAWSTIEFSVPSNVRAVLLADTSNAAFRLATNTSLCANKLLVDNLRFVNTLIERRVFHSATGTVPVVHSSGVLTFDNAGDWTSPRVTLTQDTVNKTQGTASLSFSPTNWTEINSRRFAVSEIADVTSLLNVDVYIPAYSVIPGWVGSLHAYFDCPTAGIWNEYIGQVALDNRFDDEFNSTAAQSHLFAVSGKIQAALKGGYSGCQFRFGLAASSALGTVKLDRGGFVR